MFLTVVALCTGIFLAMALNKLDRTRMNPWVRSFLKWLAIFIACLVGLIAIIFSMYVENPELFRG